MNFIRTWLSLLQLFAFPGRSLSLLGAGCRSQIQAANEQWKKKICLQQQYLWSAVIVLG